MADHLILADELHTGRQNENKFKKVIQELPVGIVTLRGGHKLFLEEANEEFLKICGYTQEELVSASRPFTSYLHQQDLDRFEEAIENCREYKSTQQLEARLLTKEGRTCWLAMQCHLGDYRNAVPYYIVAVWDVSEHKRIENGIHMVDEQFRMLEEVSDDFPYEYDVVQHQFFIPFKYHRNRKRLIQSREYLDYSELQAFIHPEDQEKYVSVIMEASQKEITGTFDFRLNTAIGKEMPNYSWYRTIYRSIMNSEGKVVKLIGRSYDISLAQEMQKSLSEESRLDPMTRLLNKVALKTAIEEFLVKSREGVHVFFLIDVDDFKKINDTFGHAVGDAVITDIAQAISAQFAEPDLVGRIGGDEFLAFMKNTTVEEAENRAKRLCNATYKRLIGDDAVVDVTLSIGISVYNKDGEEYDMLFDRADRAMYQVKRSGKNSYNFAGKIDLEQGSMRRSKRSDEDSRCFRTAADREFLDFAFGLLAHTRDIDSSLNVLVEQIGKKYGLSYVAVCEDTIDFTIEEDKGFSAEISAREPDAEASDKAAEDSIMLLTNYWSSFGIFIRQTVFPQKVESASCGELYIFNGRENKLIESFLRNCGGELTERIYTAAVRFEIPGKNTGCMYVGVTQKEGFNRSEEATLCELSRIVAVFVSLRNRMREDQREIRQLQDRDQLTGLYNIEAFRKFAVQLLYKKGNETAETENIYAIVHLDINNFSYVNENFGQRIGNSILEEFAEFICMRKNVVEACRMYSDYFIELVRGTSREEIYQKVLEQNQMFEEKQKQKYPASAMRLSAGVCFVDRKEPFESILEGANIARKQAKKDRKGNGLVVYEEDMRARRDEEQQIVGTFYGAMQKGEIEVFLQPKFLLKERKIYGAEALARWRTHTGEVLSPNRFIPPLENIGYIIDLDFHILEQLLRVMKHWKESGRQLFVISTNFSRRHFENGGAEFVNRLQKIMQKYEIEPSYIEIEVTESVLAENFSDMKRCLQQLSDLGYRIAIDDFGSGYSSLGVLLEIPANVVKIDKKITDRINNEEQRSFVANMGKFICSAEEEVIFEGIETEEQCRFLTECGFTYGQGYLFDAPVSIAEFESKYIV
jgi:diguanylate cyclase (GGDEF)-like protein/PAS domain S-box-containing protein